MNIHIEKETNRRFAYTDRKNGYLELTSQASASSTGGYFRGEQKYLSDFFISIVGSDSQPRSSAFFRNNAKYTDVKPEGFSVVYDHAGLHSTLEVSLLLHEQAFYLALREEAPLPLGMKAGLGIVLSRGVWTRHEEEGITFYQNHCGTVLASDCPFTLETTSNDTVILFPEQGEGEWYLVFEEDDISAQKKAVTLVRSRAIDAHKQQILDFFKGCISDSGDQAFDEAVRWAQFSGWLLVTNDNGKGIWAGLPWFRDNWGRDTFIALPGILLVSGRFAEAKDVLTSFAVHQNRDSTSTDYGRIPNRFRDKDDVIFNTADGTLWFIRTLWEYVQYSGDIAIFDDLRHTIDLALETDIKKRTDHHGFLLHGDADTWMDARIQGDKPWSARGDRACDIQALWYTALRIGARIAHILGDAEASISRDALAEKLRKSFRTYFWCDERHALADRLPPGAHGEWLRDFRVRPNQLFALSVPSILDSNDKDEYSLLDASQKANILENVTRELVSPFGLFSLAPDDPLFHPRHENPGQYHKDASYHNGTIWIWNTGAFISASAGNNPSDLSPVSATLLKNEAEIILSLGCAGTLAENINAECAKDGSPVLSGTWSQAWSVSEFTRNVYQDIIGFNPRLSDNSIELHPHLSEGIDRWKAEPFFGPGWKLSIELQRFKTKKGNTDLRCRLLWITDGNSRLINKTMQELPELRVNGVFLIPGKMLELHFPLTKNTNQRIDTVQEESLFPLHDFTPEWCGSIHQKEYLEKLVLRDRVNSHNGSDVNAAALEWYFDSDFFKKKYHTHLPLGSLWSPSGTVFRLWAPTARSVSLILYPDGENSFPKKVLPMKEGSLKLHNAGVWEILVEGDQSGTHYRYRIHSHGIIRDSADPFAQACGVNGLRSLVIDFKKTDPAEWDTINAPPLASKNDAVIYEVHVADISSSPDWNGDPYLRRSYLGAIQEGTSHKGVPTGFDHIKSLGITHIQLLPIFDFGSVDERLREDPTYTEKLQGGLFNWGYDPSNYCAPEGSYSSNPFNGIVRIRELKTLIRECITNGIGVIMDVVYNHVPAAQNHALGICLPGYYFRVDNYSGAGDDTASEREMFRAYMIRSLCHWLSEYKLSGFRFDLMGLHDVETMNQIVSALRNLKSDVLIYGEGWDMYHGEKMVSASMKEAHKMNGIGFFNDAFRCGIKGPVFNEHEGGYIHNGSHREAVKFGLVGAVYHPQVHNRLVDGTANQNPWTNLTASSVNYTEIHDNSTLYDKLLLVESDKNEAYYERLQKTAISLILLAQGLPVLHAGMEFMRTKEISPEILTSAPYLEDLYWTADHSRAFSHNSYNLSDKINRLDWDRCAAKRHIVEYVRLLIAVRKSHPLFRLRNEEEVNSRILFLEAESIRKHGVVEKKDTKDRKGKALLPGTPLLAWTINGNALLDTWHGVCIIVNPSDSSADFILPPYFKGGSWNLITDGEYFSDKTGSNNANNVPLTEKTGSTVSIAGKALYLYAEF